MKLFLDKDVLNLKGEPIGEKMSDILANMLAMATIGNPAKMITWAVNLTNNGYIDVDNADIGFLKGFIESAPNLVNLAKVRMLDEINNLEKPKVTYDESNFDDGCKFN